MTALELADGILAIEERIFLTKKEHQLFQNSAKMLRQQQTEIEALKKELDEQIKNTHELLGWKWKDGDYDTQLKKASEK